MIRFGITGKTRRGSFGMEKRAIIAIVLSMLVLIFYQRERGAKGIRED
jgi:hypothetical protein